MKTKLYLPFLFAIIFIISACDKNNDLIIFSIEDDKQLGAQLAQEIASNPTEYPVLDPAQYPEAYNYLNNIVDKILSSDAVTYRDEFAWEVRIIDQDVRNAFAAPGGYIYVYTGLINYLEKEDDLAGVIGHEIAHADQRHTIKQLQKVYGLQILLSIVLGNDPGAIKEIAAALAGNLTMLYFSRDAESEADDFSVQYLSSTPYQCNGAASFFEKLIENDEASDIAQFLSTHPSPENRVEAINSKANEVNCSISPYDPDSYQEFKNMLK